MTLKIHTILFLIIFTLSAEATPELPAMRATFGFEYITSGISPEHDYNTTMMSLGTEFKFKHNINLIASGAFQEKGAPEGVEFKYDLLLKYNRFRHNYTNVSLLMGYTNSTVAYQICDPRAPDLCRTYKKDDTGAIYGAGIDIKINSATVISISALKGGQLDLTRLSVLLTRPF